MRGPSGLAVGPGWSSPCVRSGSLKPAVFLPPFTLIAKVILVRSGGFPGFALPLAGGALFSIILGLWLTSALWFFRTVGVGI